MGIVPASQWRDSGTPLPPKPYPGFPLGAHRSGKWCKRIKGKLYYFGTLDDWQGALEQYEREAPYLHAGKAPPPDLDGLQLATLCNLFLEAKDGLVQSGELAKRSYNDYRNTCKRLVEHWGKKHLVGQLTQNDFQQLRKRFARDWNPTTLGNEITRIRVLFKWGYDEGHLERPMQYGQSFKRPKPKIVRQHRAAKRLANGRQMIEADEIHKLMDKALEEGKPHLKAMILLGINCGLGNEDVGRLEMGHLELDNGWLNYPRPKTGIDRRAKLWPETVQAIRDALKARPKPKVSAARPLVFVTKRGQPWAKETSDSPVTKEFRKLLDKTGTYRSVNFYGLRHGFETIGGESKDQVAVNAIMGHADASMAGMYREGLSDERLIAVADHVHEWLYRRDEV